MNEEVPIKYLNLKEDEEWDHLNSIPFVKIKPINCIHYTRNGIANSNLTIKFNTTINTTTGHLYHYYTYE